MESIVDHLPAILPSRISLPPPSSKTTTKANQSQNPATSVHPTSSFLPNTSPTYPSTVDQSPGDLPSPTGMNSSNSGSSGGLGQGAIIGIAVGVTALILLCGGGWLLRRRRARLYKQHGLEDQEAMERLSRQQRDKRATLTLSKSIHKPLDFSALGVSPSREDIHADYHEQYSLHQRPSTEKPGWTHGNKGNNNNNSKSPLDYQRQVPPMEVLYRTTAEYPPRPLGSSSNNAVSSSALTLVTTQRQSTGKLPSISPVSPMGSIFSGLGLHKRLSALLAESIGYCPPPPVPSMPSAYLSGQGAPPIRLLTRPGPSEAEGFKPTDRTISETSTQNATPGKSQADRRVSGPRLGGRKARVPSCPDGHAVPSSDTPC